MFLPYAQGSCPVGGWGGQIWGYPGPRESSPSTLVFGHGLLFLMSQFTLILIIYMQINILKANTAGLFCIPKYSKIALSVFPTPNTD